MPVSGFVYDGDNNMHKREDESDGDPNIEFFVFDEGDRPSEGHENNDEDERGIWECMEQKIHYIQNVEVFAVGICIDEMVGIFERNGSYPCI